MVISEEVKDICTETGIIKILVLLQLNLPKHYSGLHPGRLWTSRQWHEVVDIVLAIALVTWITRGSTSISLLWLHTHKICVCLCVYNLNSSMCFSRPSITWKHPSKSTSHPPCILSILFCSVFSVEFALFVSSSKSLLS